MTSGILYYSLPPGCGYGDAAVEYIVGLLSAGIPVSWVPVIPKSTGYIPLVDLSGTDRPTLKPELSVHRTAYDCLELDIDYDAVVLHVIPELFPRLRRTGKTNVGITVWETDRLPEHWPELIRCVDRLAVPCRFNLELFAQPGGPSVSLLPHMPPVRDEIPGSERVNRFRASIGAGPHTMVYYSINAWAPRKAIWETLHAYMLAFTADDDVCLVFKTDGEGYDYSIKKNSPLKPTREMIADICRVYPDPAPVMIMDEPLPRHDMDLLHHACDCYLSLTHCEGWGLGAFAAACAGNPVIITGWGGHLDYLSDPHAYLVDYRLDKLEPSRFWDSYTAEQNWAYADIDHAIELIRHTFHHQSEAMEKGLASRNRIATGFSRERTQDQLLDLVNA